MINISQLCKKLLENSCIIGKFPIPTAWVFRTFKSFLSTYFFPLNDDYESFKGSKLKKKLSIKINIVL